MNPASPTGVIHADVFTASTVTGDEFAPSFSMYESDLNSSSLCQKINLEDMGRLVQKILIK